MTGKVISIIKNGSIVVPRLLLTGYKKLNVTEKELVLLIYLLDINEFNPEKIASDLGMKISDVLMLVDSLSKKDILKIKLTQNNKIREEVVCLDELYNKLAIMLMDGQENTEKPNTVFDQFEKEFGRSLSPMEFEIIGAWMEAGFTEELILLALKEAVYNKVSNLRYIDTILSQWRKKGIKNEKDVLNQRKKISRKETKKEVFDYDWLNE